MVPKDEANTTEDGVERWRELNLWDSTKLLDQT